MTLGEQQREITTGLTRYFHELKFIVHNSKLSRKFTYKYAVKHEREIIWETGQNRTF